MFKIVVYAAMNRIYSCRDIESACKRDINFMYLLEGKPAPDHATIARFLSLHFSQCSKKTLAEVTGLLKDLETLEGYIARLKEYNQKIHTCGDRNSYSKTDPDATFMRMKEDHMLNGQLKPAYNLQHGVDSEYITWLDVTQRPTDTRTLIPFLKDMEEHLPFRYRDIVADAGYESEENYLFIEGNGQVAFIKPNNYEKAKTRRYKKDIGRMENMEYDKERDCYICSMGKEIPWVYDQKEKTATGYRRTTSVYRCGDCKGCPRKTECIKGNN